MCLLELNFLREITNNDPVLIRQFVSDFLIEEEEFEGILKQYNQVSNYKNIGKAVHKFKSCIKIIGVPCLEKEFELLEGYLKKQDFNNIRCEIHQIQMILNDTKKELQSCL